MQYFLYLLQRKDEHSLHPPFIFDLYTKVIRTDIDKKAYDYIENLRAQLSKSTSKVHNTRFGAAGIQGSNTTKTIKQIVKYELIEPQSGRLLARLVNHFNCRQVLEFGTSLGISTLYLTHTNVVDNCHTIEANAEIHEIAKKNFAKCNRKNVVSKLQTIDDFLELQSWENFRPSLIYLDANHEHDATIRYFKALLGYANKNTKHQIILVFDDIYWSMGMLKAWNCIISNKYCKLSLDLYRLGIVFLNFNVQKGHYKLKF